MISGLEKHKKTGNEPKHPENKSKTIRKKIFKRTLAPFPAEPPQRPPGQARFVAAPGSEMTP